MNVPLIYQLILYFTFLAVLVGLQQFPIVTANLNEVFVNEFLKLQEYITLRIDEKLDIDYF